jgi:hypothetical protein
MVKGPPSASTAPTTSPLVLVTTFPEIVQFVTSTGPLPSTTIGAGADPVLPPTPVIVTWSTAKPVPAAEISALGARSR